MDTDWTTSVVVYWTTRLHKGRRVEPRMAWRIFFLKSSTYKPVTVKIIFYEYIICSNIKRVQIFCLSPSNLLYMPVVTNVLSHLQNMYFLCYVQLCETLIQFELSTVRINYKRNINFHLHKLVLISQKIFAITCTCFVNTSVHVKWKIQMLISYVANKHKIATGEQSSRRLVINFAIF